MIHILIILFLLISSSLYAQKSKKEPVEILNTDVLTIFQSDSGEVRQLTGNVQFRQDSVLMYCDSALHYPTINFLEAHSRVKIIISDTTIITGDELNYDGETKVADLFRSVVMKDGKMTLTTDRLTYYRSSGIAVYPQKGKIVDGENVLTSETGFYHTDEAKAYFRRKVVLTNPEFRLITDTLAYHTESKTAFFMDTTYIYTKSDTLYTRDGWYDTRKQYAELYNRSWMRDSTYQVCADTLKFDEQYQFGEGIGAVEMMKKDSSATIYGGCAEMIKNQGKSYVYQAPWMVYKMEEDTLHMTARIFYASNDTLTDTSRIMAYGNVKIVMRNLQGICDSLSYTDGDSLIEMMQDPVIWSELNQMSGDTIRIWMKNETADSMRVLQKCFLISKEDTVGYNQIKGRQIYGKFKDEALYRMLISGNAESVYFSKNDEKNSYEGLNKSLSNEMLMYFGDNKPVRITFITKPEGEFIPMFEVMESPVQLEDFRWRPEDRPEHNKVLSNLPWSEATKYLKP